MIRIRCILFLFFLLFFSQSIHVWAASPQYLVLNFAQMNERHWDAPQEEWEKTIKPQVIKEITEMRKTLTNGQLSSPRYLAWSTLMEYMNFPLDTPNDQSPYVIKMKRMLEIAEELDLPIFVPLNGFQWWDQLPELYNWWDSDGTHTDPAFFKRQKNPEEFKQRFIRGYNPNNRWNVEWKDWQTPMQLNYRNWGGGGFRLAPPPNLLGNTRAPITYRKIQAQRFRAIVSVISTQYKQWQSQQKGYLLVGISIGTEISLNASVTPQDEFAPYGYRSIQDLLCSSDHPICKTGQPLESNEVLQARQDVVQTYLTDLSRLATKQGIPKDLVYTHVFSETTKENPKYTNYAAAAFNLYSRAGMSFYGYASNPLSLPVWKDSLRINGYPHWGAVEYSTPMTKDAWHTGLTQTFDNTISPASILVHYNWPDPKGTAAILSMRDWLQEKPPELSCEPPTIHLTTEDYARSPTLFTWKVDTNKTKPEQLIVHIQSGIVAHPRVNDKPIIMDATATSTFVPSLSPGNYTWYVEAIGCNGKNISTSTPLNFTVFSQTSEDIPAWVKLFFRTKE